MVVLRPFLSLKAARKLHKVRTKSLALQLQTCVLAGRPDMLQEPGQSGGLMHLLCRQVDSLLDIDAVTGGDVKAEQLGASFLTQVMPLAARTQHALQAAWLPLPAVVSLTGPETCIISHCNRSWVWSLVLA